MAKKIGADYKGTVTLEVLEGAKRYNEWIADTILPFVDSPFLEIGSGIGNISSFFVKKKHVTLSENDDYFISLLKKKFAKASVIKFDIESDLPQSLKNKFNTVVGINVLEHIKDDEKALFNIKKTIKKNGKIVLLVPAKQFAYNKLDKELGHFRRYEKKELLQKLERTGFKIEKVRYFNSVGLITWIVRNYLSRQNIQLTSKQVALFDAIVPVLRTVEKIIPVPIGISLVVVAVNE